MRLFTLFRIKDGPRPFTFRSGSWKSAKAVKTKGEEEKIALRRSVNANFFYQLGIGIISLFITLIVLQLTFRSVYRSDQVASKWVRHWYTFNLGQEQEANMLQLLAKVHELFMVTTLYSIVLHVARRLLVGPRGMPFGLLVGGYQLSSSVLLGRSIWAPMWQSLVQRQWRTAAFAFGLLLSILLANTLGPASAVAMIPRLGWWDLKDPFDGKQFPSFVVPNLGDSDGTPLDRLYPARLDSTVLPGAEFGCAEADTMTTFCPGGGHEYIEYWARVFSATYFNQFTDVLPEEAGLSTFIQETRGTSADGTWITHASGLHLTVASVVSSYHRWGRAFPGPRMFSERALLRPTKDSDVRGPVARTSCTPLILSSSLDVDGAKNDMDLRFPTRWLDLNVEEEPWRVPLDVLNTTTRPRNTTTLTWVDVPPDTPVSHLASIGAVVTLPYVGDTSDNWSQELGVTACVIEAQWAKTDISIADGSESLTLIDNSLMDEAMRDAFCYSLTAENRTELGLSSVVGISREWAGLINTPGWNYTDRLGNKYTGDAVQSHLQWFINDTFLDDNTTTALHHFQSPYPMSPWDEQDPLVNNAVMVSGVLSMSVAEAMSRVGLDSNDMFLLMLPDLQPDDNVIEAIQVGWQYRSTAFGLGDKFNVTKDMTRNTTSVSLNFEFEHYGYGYGFRGESATLIFAVVILLTHAALVVIYFVYLAFFCCMGGYLSSAWDDLGDLIALALSSKEASKRMGSVGAGVNRATTWNLDVRIRERTFEYDKLDMVVGGIDDRFASQGLPCAGKRYR